ncbi:DUF7507 domain-containing protein [Zooshikella ganghwensis]|uniref:DUF7507 domain-containing protein n=1 Tax=Zooshikella ganghwensis TaxID=202772 RepID=UPI00040F2AA2|nr:hypothetical protein [Zooshikella ganghwensis]
MSLKNMLLRLFFAQNFYLCDKKFVIFLCCLLGNSSMSVFAMDTEEAFCMEETAGFSVQCSANDVRVAGVATNPDGTPQLQILDDGCAYQGDTVSFTATFEVEASAKERHDIGVYFVTDGDPNNDGAQSGRCSISTMPYQPNPPWLDLDGTNDPFPGTNDPSGVQDTCGDIDKPGHNPLYPTITLTAVCIDPDKDGKLNLPYCTSWRQAGANELCVKPTDAFPGSPSKCKCDETFNIPIDVPPAELLVNKAVNPTQLNEPGGEVTFTVAVTNVGIDPNNDVTLNSLVDDIYGDITQSGHDNILNTTCSTPQTIPSDDRNPGGIDTYSCQFTVLIEGNAGMVETDTVTAQGTDNNGNSLSGQDSATVTLLDELPEIVVNKSVSPSELIEPGGNVTFTVSVNNVSSASSDPVTLSELVDNIYGNLSGLGTCSTPQTIHPGATYTCLFTMNVTGNAGDAETDTVTASGSDDDGNAVAASDSATVVIQNVPSAISLVKTANPVQVYEPGGKVTYTYVVSNDSSVDSVTINSLTDDILGGLNGQGTCSLPHTLVAGASYTCLVSSVVNGNGHDSITNVAEAKGIDDDGEAVSAMDDATVNISNVPPAASLSKVVSSALVTYTVTISNDSDAEPLTVNSLMDDKFGDITKIQGSIKNTSCIVPQQLQPATQPGDSYTCTFDALVNTVPHTNTVEGSVVDDDGSAPVEPTSSATISWE